VPNEAQRKANYINTDQRIQAHNNDPNLTYKQGHNLFSHLVFPYSHFIKLQNTTLN